MTDEDKEKLFNKLIDAARDLKVAGVSEHDIIVNVSMGFAEAADAVKDNVGRILARKANRTIAVAASASVTIPNCSAAALWYGYVVRQGRARCGKVRPLRDKDMARLGVVKA
jgi:hypothetical protein